MTEDKRSDTQLIIANYQEDLNWVSRFQHTCFVYRKGNSNFEFGNNVLTFDLPNIGREAHTFLHHIVENYDNLGEYNIFLQGNPFDHFKEIERCLNDLPYSLDVCKRYSEGCYGLADDHLDETIAFCNNIRVYPESIDRIYFEVHPVKYVFSSGAQYFVNRKNIINKSKKFYYNLLTNLKWDSHEPWSMERLWPMVFDANDRFGHKG